VGNMILPEGRPFREGQCAKCKLPMLVRPDNLPLCSGCEKLMLEEVAQKFPHLAKGGKLRLYSRAQTK